MGCGPECLKESDVTEHTCTHVLFCLNFSFPPSLSSFLLASLSSSLSSPPSSSFPLLQHDGWMASSTQRT